MLILVIPFQALMRTNAPNASFMMNMNKLALELEREKSSPSSSSAEGGGAMLVREPNSPTFMVQ